MHLNHDNAVKSKKWSTASENTYSKLIKWNSKYIQIEIESNGWIHTAKKTKAEWNKLRA